MDGVFDAKKIERVFFNLILNACEATSQGNGAIRVQLASANGSFQARVEDDGPGVAATVRDRLFQPFVSYGKANGTGLGLAIVNKIIYDHRGKIRLVESSSAGAIFEIGFPRAVRSS
jgi:signal transduction histidine kinase